MTLNLLAGVAFAIAAIVLYSINIANMWVWICEDYDYSYRRHHTPSPHEDMIREKCEEGRAMVLVSFYINVNVYNLIIVFIHRISTLITAANMYTSPRRGMRFKSIWNETNKHVRTF